MVVCEFNNAAFTLQTPTMDTSKFTVELRMIAPVPGYNQLADEVEFLIGGFGQRLVLLHSSGWVCSVDNKHPILAIIFCYSSRLAQHEHCFSLSPYVSLCDSLSMLHLRPLVHDR